MRKQLSIGLLAAAVSIGTPSTPAFGQPPVQQAQPAQIGFIKLDREMKLRRMVVAKGKPKGTVLLLHGFPETLHTWDGVAQALSADYEVHAFDWPGFGQSSRPAADRFSYSPRDYARILRNYVEKAGIDRSKLTVYATDIGALPALLAALEEPGIARTIIVGDFAPFNRPEYMHERLQRLKAKPSSDAARAELNAGRDEVLQNAFTRGLPAESTFELSQLFKDDMARGWDHGELTSADAFYYYYSHFTRDQDHFEANLTRLKTPVKVVWGAGDIYIKKEMGIELAEKLGTRISILRGIGHYGHLQAPQQVADEIRAAMQ